MSIFVQLTSYRNFDVVTTVRDCITKAKDQDGLHFGIVLQQDEDVPAELNHERIKVERVQIKDSLGHGWARSRAQAMYGGQDFTLQVDAGCRFAEGWDEELIRALGIAGGERAIVTNPANMFNPTNGNLEFKDTAYKLQAFQFYFDAPSFWPVAMKGAVAMQRARSVSDHFLFTQGRHCTECPYDPGLYYSEIEAAITLRSYTLGYDIYHHFKPLVFRNYAPRPMNWSDDTEWWLKDKASKARFAALVRGEATEFGLGTARSARDFELYSGIDFVGKALQRDVVSGGEPPSKYENEDAWRAGYMRDHSMSVSWDPDKIEAADDYDYWLFTVEDAAGVVINRQDLRWERDKDALERRVRAKKIFFKAPANMRPAKIGIQPFSKGRGALAKATFDV